MDRRTFIKGSAAVIPGSVALDMLMSRSFAFAQGADFTSDVDVLNYALTLEYLESAFYKQGNARGLLTGVEAQYLQQVGADEDAHVTLLTQTIQKMGGTPVAAPQVDFKDSFASRSSFLTAADTFENTGVSAYLGAAGFIKSKPILQAAAGIFGVECRHAAVIGNLLGLAPEGGVFKGATESPLAKAQVLQAVSPYIVKQ
jgi:hypothetical protein